MSAEGQDVGAALAFYDRISRGYDRLADASEHESRERGLELLAPAKGEHILEIGFGTGQGEREKVLSQSYKWLHRHFPHVFDCRPIDALARLRAAGFKPCRVTEILVWTLPVVALVAVPEG
jgi:SAM-dependent methyltransferase